jgi:hypothetical protein
MKLKATKSFHTSGVGTVHQGTEFEVHDALGKELSDKGLASVVEASTDTAAGADASEPHAKQERPLSNKAEVVPKTKRKAEAPSEPVPE